MVKDKFLFRISNFSPAPGPNQHGFDFDTHTLFIFRSSPMERAPDVPLALSSSDGSVAALTATTLSPLLEPAPADPGKVRSRSKHRISGRPKKDKKDRKDRIATIENQHSSSTISASPPPSNILSTSPPPEAVTSDIESDSPRSRPTSPPMMDASGTHVVEPISIPLPRSNLGIHQHTGSGPNVAISIISEPDRASRNGADSPIISPREGRSHIVGEVRKIIRTV